MLNKIRAEIEDMAEFKVRNLSVNERKSLLSYLFKIKGSKTKTIGRD